MRSGKWYLLNIILLTIAIGSFLSTGCKRFDGIDNNKVIRTPYGVYFADGLGSMYNTNDGVAYKLIFPSDGVAARALVTSSTNLMWIKYNQRIQPNGTLFLSQDDGYHYNPKDYDLNPLSTWQNQIIDVPTWGLMYASSVTAHSVILSQDNGLTWEDDITLNPASGMSIQSFTQLKSGKLYGLDYQNIRLFEKLNKNTAWTEVTSNFPLPPGKWQLGHMNEVLLAANNNPSGGVYYSTDNGVDWQPYNGLPANHKVNMVAGPLDQVMLAGLDSVGIYRLDKTNNFQQSNNGILTNTTVYSIVGKEDIYKNEVIKQYVYIATSTGLYRSEDLGQNWVLMRPGDIRNVY